MGGTPLVPQSSCLTLGVVQVLSVGLEARKPHLRWQLWLFGPTKGILQVGHEPMPPTIGTNVLGRKVLYLPSFFTYAKYIVQVDGKIGLFRGLSPRLMSNALSTVTRGSMKKVFPPDEMEQVSNKDDMKTSLKKGGSVVPPGDLAFLPCLLDSGVLSSIGKIFKEEGLLGFFVGLIPHLLGDVVFLWGCNLLAHFINAYLVDDSFSQALAIRSYTKFVMGIAVSMLTYPFLLVGDLMAVNNCGLQAGLPPYSPVFKSWIHCWKYLSMQGQLFRGSSLLFRRVSSGSCFALE
ncbi:mitochondrial carrier homolog 1 [Echinops telfairi]|uniref:Mitochondrial carrier homolog 1 n=1 Tax=Echinops telfairi TaxID=9371 RepID=A0AC55DG42_ECHTE|nr:mitochondrial carrier homolog 1 [Echinops telfairi]